MASSQNLDQTFCNVKYLSFYFFFFFQNEHYYHPELLKTPSSFIGFDDSYNTIVQICEALSPC